MRRWMRRAALGRAKHPVGARPDALGFAVYHDILFRQCQNNCAKPSSSWNAKWKAGEAVGSLLTLD